MKTLATAIAVSLVVVGLLIACGSSGKATAAGGSCTADSECATALSCIDMSTTFVTSNDAGCSGATMHGLSVCTLACTSDADCTAVSAGLVCAPNGCTTKGYCLQKSDAGIAMTGSR